MSKESIVFLLGGIVFFTSFLGVPSEYKEWTFIVSGLLLMAAGYSLRRKAFLKSLENESGMRSGDVFAESSVIRESGVTDSSSEEKLS